MIGIIVTRKISFYFFQFLSLFRCTEYLISVERFVLKTERRRNTGKCNAQCIIIYIVNRSQPKPNWNWFSTNVYMECKLAGTIPREQAMRVENAFSIIYVCIYDKIQRVLFMMLFYGSRSDSHINIEIYLYTHDFLCERVCIYYMVWMCYTPFGYLYDK